MTFRVYESAQALFHGVVAAVAHEGADVAPITDVTSVGSNFGSAQRGTQEIIAGGFVLTNPRARLILSSARPVDLCFAIASTLWTMAGRDDLKSIAFYNPRGRSFSDDGVMLSGALGRRIVGDDGGQLKAVLSRLRDDPTSRRGAVLSLRASDVVRPPRDTPCSIAFQYLVREGQLVAVTFMRSQSVVGVLPYDLFTYTMLQESVAVTLGIEVGAYYHIAGSLHYYDDEQETVARVLDEEAVPLMPMPRMTTSMLGGDSVLALAEEDVRTRLAADPGADVDVYSYGLGSYWTGLLSVLVVGVRQRLGCPIPARELESVPSCYRSHLSYGKQ